MLVTVCTSILAAIFATFIAAIVDVLMYKHGAVIIEQVVVWVVIFMCAFYGSVNFMLWVWTHYA